MNILLPHLPKLGMKKSLRRTIGFNKNKKAGVSFLKNVYITMNKINNPNTEVAPVYNKFRFEESVCFSEKYILLSSSSIGVGLNSLIGIV